MDTEQRLAEIRERIAVDVSIGGYHGLALADIPWLLDEVARLRQMVDAYRNDQGTSSTLKPKGTSKQ